MGMGRNGVVRPKKCGQRRNKRSRKLFVIVKIFSFTLSIKESCWECFVQCNVMICPLLQGGYSYSVKIRVSEAKGRNK